MNVAELFERQARSRQDQPALVMGKYKATHGELFTMMCVIAARLHAGGVQRGDRVGVCVRQPVASVALTLALAHIGAVSVAVPVPVGDELLDAVAGDCGMTWVVHDRATHHILQRVAPQRQFMFSALAAQPEPGLRIPVMANVAPDDVWRVSLSSGTTGAPKGIEWTNGCSILTANLRRVVTPTSAQDRVLLAMDPAMNYAVHNWLRTLDAGACIVMPVSRSSEDAVRAAIDHRATQAITTTGTALGMVRYARSEEAGLAGPVPGLASIWVGGAMMSPQLRAALTAHISPAVFNNYGATEIGMAALADPVLAAQHPECAGRLMSWVEAQAIGPDGQVLPPGKRGLLRFRSPTMALRYSGSADANDQAFRDGWFHSNDRGAVTPDGLMWLDGRGDDVLNLAGVKVDPTRIESVIEEDPAIVESAVVVVPDAIGAPILVAVIVAPQGADAEALRQRCLAKLGANCQPRGVVTVPALPRNAAGKIERETLRSKVRMGAKPEGQAPAAPAPAPEIADDALKFE
ncbi:MAG: class I adenylate-forming enzyme family protein [Pseudomonadota bacterium]